ncbi:hypothetical protein CAPTEDRAFT_201650 [Capitella teleta]|uniref:Uncharacterized protein n=1 Tax=Capitella teleta TaxID=283909 RepID=R7V3X5_CAPTE|nr:hypothetical protein CAPTEDRAFT_201650 [Capitella teleta]|eukprot:ELU13239.1 hypothetical protein CAPTEDRAFT_201650 [Capitella teleta]
MSETDATPPDDPGDQSSPVTNALLGYVFNCMHFSSVYNLRAVVLGHFSADAIHKAKETLAQHVASSVVGEAFFTTRRGSSARGKAKARTGKAKEKEEMELDDIIEAMEVMDKAGVSVEFHISAFELHLLPRTRPEDLLSVTFMENVKRLEARVAALDTHAALSTEQMSILKQKVDHLETTAHASGSSCVSPETIPMSSMHFSSLNAINSAGTMSSSMDPTSSAPVYSTRDKPFLEPNHANPPRSYSVALQKNSDGGTAIPWTKVRKTRKSRPINRTDVKNATQQLRTVTGKSACDSELVGSMPAKHIYVSKLNTDLITSVITCEKRISTSYGYTAQKDTASLKA